MILGLRLRAFWWLAFLVPLFFLTYDYANTAASHRAHVAVLMFSWERRLPFLAWTIAPYWSSDVFYVLSLLMCTTRAEVDLHGKRLIAIQIFSVACFLVFPLRCVFVRPPVSGWEADLFAALGSFDLPFNQAPSLHVGLAVILWARFREHTAGLLRIALGAWFVLIAVSTLTTYQHQFIDVATGLWAGVLVLAALPERRVAGAQVALTLAYLAGSVACTAAAFMLRGFGWLMLWPGFSLSMVAAAYWTGDSKWLGRRNGPMTLLLLPYSVAAWINSRLWTHGQPTKNHIVEAVWIGRAPLPMGRDGMNSVVDLAPELRVSGAAHVAAHVAMLDLTPPTDEQLDAAVRAIMKFSGQRPTLVCCALGYSRSAVASAAWLIAAGHAANPEDALDRVRSARPQIVVGPKFARRLEQWAERRNGHAH